MLLFDETTDLTGEDNCVDIICLDFLKVFDLFLQEILPYIIPGNI